MLKNICMRQKYHEKLPNMQRDTCKYRTSKGTCEVLGMHRIVNDIARKLKKYVHKVGLLDQAVILFNCVSFQNGNFS